MTSGEEAVIVEKLESMARDIAEIKTQVMCDGNGRTRRSSCGVPGYGGRFGGHELAADVGGWYGHGGLIEPMHLTN